jgi:hypothetical protein
VSSPYELEEARRRERARTLGAGEYVLVAQSWDEPVGELRWVLDPLTLQQVPEAQEVVRHVKGDLVTLDVENARRLYATGAVELPEDIDARRVERAKAALRQAYASVRLLPAEQQEALLRGLPPLPSDESVPPT